MPEIEREPIAGRERIVETPDEARAAETGHGVRYVLAIGTAAAVLLFGVVYVFFFT